MSTIRIQTDDFDLTEEHAIIRERHHNVGAIASFVGVVRDVNDANGVSSMTLEHYPGMTEKALTKIVDEAANRWDIIDTTVIHRVGTLFPADQIVLVMVASSHRRHAFEACEYIMDFLKTEAPFWKKETTPSGTHWVDARSSDMSVLKRWTTK
ncbi:MAG: molybdopterin synthase catalytic subunit MoaE [Pseudomonadota bacterium]